MAPPHQMPGRPTPHQVVPGRSPGSRLTRPNVPDTNKEETNNNNNNNNNNPAQWIQKAQLENAISEEAANSQAIKEKAHQQQRQIHLLGNQVSEYEGIIHDGETRADANDAKAKELRTSLTQERRLAQINENYTQQVEKRCDELEKMNSNLRRSSAEREKIWKRQLGQTEKRVHDLEEALSISSSGLQAYRRQVLKTVDDWTLLKDALRERNELEDPKNERIGRLMESVLQVINGSEALCQSVMDHLRVRQDGKSGGQPRKPERLSTALVDVEMSGASDSLGSKHDSTMPRAMSICSVISDSPRDGDINMENAGPFTDSAMFDLTDTDSMMLEDDGQDTEMTRDWTGMNSPCSPPHSVYSQSSNNLDSDSDSRFPSRPGSIRFPSRKRARYIETFDDPSSSEPEDDGLENKRIKVSSRSLGQARERTPNGKQVEQATSSSVTPTQLFTTLTSLSIDLRFVEPVTVYTVSPKLPQLPPLPPSLSHGTQTEEPPGPEKPVAVSVRSEDLLQQYMQTQTSAPECVSRGVQMDESFAEYIKTKKQTGPPKKIQKRRTQAVNERVRSLMPGTWPRQTTVGPGDHPSTTMMANQRDVLANRQKRVQQAVTRWALRMFQKHPRDLILGMVSLVALLYLWHSHRVHREWMAVNQIPRSVMAELRHRRVGELRWMESMRYGLARWLNVDRVPLG